MSVKKTAEFITDVTKSVKINLVVLFWSDSKIEKNPGTPYRATTGCTGVITISDNSLAGMDRLRNLDHFFDIGELLLQELLNTHLQRHGGHRAGTACAFQADLHGACIIEANELDVPAVALKRWPNLFYRILKLFFCHEKPPNDLSIQNNVMFDYTPFRSSLE
jgi:hypothetical protein